MDQEPNPRWVGELPAHTGRAMLGIAGADAAVDAIEAWNAAAVVCLLTPGEMAAAGLGNMAAEVRRRHMEWHAWPVAAGGVPDEAFMAAWPARAAAMQSILACGGRVLLQSGDGLGRAAMVAARLLAERGRVAAAMVAAVRAVRPGAIAVAAQEAWALAGAAPRRAKPGPARNRAVGAMLGLAVGDAVGAAIEFSAKPRFAVLDDMVGGGPFSLARGQWTDDTAMALALADSLVADPALDAADLMRRFVEWADTGSYSCTGECFDIGNATRAALDRFGRTGDPLAGSTAASASGNGALMRLAPVAIRHWRDREEMFRVAALQTRVTHGSPETLAASAAFAAMLADVISGTELCTAIQIRELEALPVSSRELPRDRVRGSGYVVQSLQAALWAVGRTTSFRSAVLLAANLGEDADTTAAIAGQLAGAVYGARGMPGEWLAALAWRGRLQAAANALFTAGEAADGARTAARPKEVQMAALAMTQDWSLRERLRALAELAQSTPAGHEPQHFHQVAYDYGWVRDLDWPRWRQTKDGHRLMSKAAAVAEANEDDLACIITTCCRAERFCDGYIEEACQAGLIDWVMARAAELLAAAEARFGPLTR